MFNLPKLIILALVALAVTSATGVTLAGLFYNVLNSNQISRKDTPDQREDAVATEVYCIAMKVSLATCRT